MPRSKKSHNIPEIQKDLLEMISRLNSHVITINHELGELKGEVKAIKYALYIIVSLLSALFIKLIFI